MKINKYFLFFISFIFLIVIFAVFYGRLSMFFVDTSREVYIPMAMNKGALLYKDIFNVYAPLGYQINALLTKIFGENLNVYYWIGFINSLIILTALYYIMNLFIKKQYYIYSALFIIITSCIFAVSLDNYIFPYSYSMVYALNAFLWSLYFLLLYHKKDKDKYIILSCFFIGLSLAFKYEFIMFLLVVICEMRIKKCSLKCILYSILAFISVGIISLSTLLFQGVSFNDLYQAFIYMIKLSKSQSVHYLYSYLGFIPDISSIKMLSKNLSCFCLFTIILFYLIKYSLKKLILLCSFVFIILSYTYIYPCMVESNAYIFNSIGIFTVILLIAYIIFLRKKQNKTSKDKLMLLLFICAILASFKCIFSISFNSYGTYYFPILFSTLFIFFINYFPRFIKQINKKELKLYRNLLSLFVTIAALLYCLSNITRAGISHPYLLQTNKGTIYTEKVFEKSITETLNYINENTSKNDTILVLPEGAMINFLTDRKSNNKYYYLIPPNIEIFTEEKIYNDLKNNLPDYIILQPMSYNNFGQTYFCESFGMKICSLLGEYYNIPKVFGNDFWLAVYKKKD